ncbi:MAG: hypothetical protein GDA36_01485 [Rhodobacteraceae bacterium]|nr:hypothetical protein [Paracoccaceae bacterium]
MRIRSTVGPGWTGGAAGAGADSLTGGAGRDVFVFRAFDGATITDFKDSMDRNWIPEGGFDDLAIADSSGAVVVTRDGGPLTLMGVEFTDLTADDFFFG